MPQVMFLGQTYPARSHNIAADRCINLYPEIAPGDAKGQVNSSGGVIALIGTPGSRLAFNVAASVIRGMHVFNNLLYFVAGNGLYSMNSGGTVTGPLLTLATSTGRVIIVNNGLKSSGGVGQPGGDELYIVDGTQTGYIWNVITETATETIGGLTATYLDGYFITNTPQSMVLRASDAFDGTVFTDFAFGIALLSSDNVQAVSNMNDQLWVIKEYNSQIWANNGQPTSASFPFSLIPGTGIDYGTPAPYSVARGDQAIFMVGNARQGDSGKFCGIIMLQGNTPAIVSPPAVNYQISQYPTISDAFGYCRVHEGHSFYVVTFPSANNGDGATWVYDRTTQMFHEWSSYRDPFRIGRHLSNCYAFFSQKEYVGDYNTGNVYELSSTIYTENTEPIVAQRISQHQFDRNKLANVFINRLQVDMETGIGDEGVVAQTGIDPKASLAWSNDGGRTYGSEYLASLGKVGKYMTRLIWRRLGYARDRVFRLTISDPVRRIITGVYVNE